MDRQRKSRAAQLEPSDQEGKQDEIKAKLQWPFSWDLDQRCPQGNRPLYAKLTVKEPPDKQSKKSQTKAAAPQSKPSNGPQRSMQGTEADAEKARKKKKKIGNRKNEKRKRLVPVLVVPRPQDLMRQLRRRRSKASSKISGRSPLGTAIKKDLIPTSALSLPNQKTDSVGNFYVSDC